MTLDGRSGHNLPLQLSCFIGRKHEMAEVSSLLATTRLLTLTGPAGCGKTRLALAVSASLHAAQSYADGTWLVELATISEPALVPQTVATALGLPEIPDQLLRATVAASLQPRHFLLLLDNCEHLLAACARLVDRLLHLCPRLSVLTTSREPLHITGEVIWPVSPFPLPDLQPLPSVDALSRYEAVQLFVERAKAVLPTFALADHNATAVATICARLDGLPLAIELAAARIKMLSAAQIAARLTDRFQLLVNGTNPAQPHHQTLKAALDWSYGLLTQPEQLLLRRLALFACSFSLEAAEAISSDKDETREQIAESTHLHSSPITLLPSDILDLLARLVDKSLVVVERKPGEARRYRLLETILIYSIEKLHASGEEAMIHGRHRDWCLALLERAEWSLHHIAQDKWADWLAGEHNDLQTALSWSAESGDTEIELQIVNLYQVVHKHFGFSLGEGEHTISEPYLNATPTQLVEAIFAAVSLERRAAMVEPAVKYTSAHVDPPTLSPAASLAPANLTPREVEVLRLLAAGKSNQEIATELVLSIRTAERHIANIYEKIGARGKTARAAATAFAFAHGLLPAPNHPQPT